MPLQDAANRFPGNRALIRRASVERIVKNRLKQDTRRPQMSEFPECLLIVIAEVDAAIEGEWNRWYDTVHLPDALRCPGVRRGRRYVSAGEMSETAAGKTERTARRIYTTIYELDSPDAIATPEFRAMRGWYQFAPHVRSRTQVIVPVQGRSVS